MKKRMIAGLLAGMALTASAAVLSDFEMNDAANTRLAQLQNSASGAGQFNYGANNMLADGNGLLVYTLGGTNANYARAALATQTNSGIQKMTFSIDSATLAGSNGKLSYAIRDQTAGKDVVMAQLVKNNDRLRLVMQDWGAGHVANLTAVGVYDLPDVLNVEVIYDLDSDLADFSWTMGSDSGTATNVAIGNYTAEVVRNVYQPKDMLDTDFIKVDYLKVESVPEPATLGLFGLIGGAVLFVRRRFMI